MGLHIRGPQSSNKGGLQDLGIGWVPLPALHTRGGRCSPLITSTLAPIPHSQPILNPNPNLGLSEPCPDHDPDPDPD